MQKFTVRMYPQAVRDLDRLPKEHAEMIVDALPALQENPFPRGKSIKKIKGKKEVLYRLRVNQFRVFYRIKGSEVFIYAVVAKKDADKFIKNR